MNLLKVSIAAALLGVLAILLFIRFNDQNKGKIIELKEGQTGKIVGMVNSVYVSKGNVFLKVADTSGEISVVAFNSSNIEEAYNIEVGDQISVLGKVKSYKGSLEIIANDIKKV